VTDRTTEIRAELKQLIKQGWMTLVVELAAKASPEVAASLKEQLEQARETKQEPKAGITEPEAGGGKASAGASDFGNSYQGWYSRALRVVGQLLPDRYDEFRDLYRPEKRRELDVMTYGVADYIAGVTVTRGYPATPEFDRVTVGLGRFQQQISILQSAEPRLDSLLSDIRGVLEAELVDDELDAARELLKTGHRRSAGMVAGVVLERHLKRVVQNHTIPFRKKAMLANLNQALKDANVYGTVEWRRLQHLTDVRNLCGHDAERDPTADEVDELIRGVDRVVKTVS
jgi:hypothetical protein